MYRFRFSIQEGLLTLEDTATREIMVIGNRRLGLGEIPSDARVFQISPHSAVMVAKSLNRVFYLFLRQFGLSLEVSIVGWELDVSGRELVLTEEGAFFIGEKDYIFISSEMFSGEVPEGSKTFAYRNCLVSIGRNEIWISRAGRRSIISYDRMIKHPEVEFSSGGKGSIEVHVFAKNVLFRISVDEKGEVRYGKKEVHGPSSSA